MCSALGEFSKVAKRNLELGTMVLGNNTNCSGVAFVFAKSLVTGNELAPPCVLPSPSCSVPLMQRQRHLSMLSVMVPHLVPRKPQRPQPSDDMIPG
jgi:hypothetical protein